MIKWYPIIAVCVWTLPLLYRIGEAFGWQNNVINHIRGVCFYIQGVLDAIAYCCTAPVFESWRGALRATRMENSSLLQELQTENIFDDFGDIITTNASDIRIEVSTVRHSCITDDEGDIRVPSVVSICSDAV